MCSSVSLVCLASSCNYCRLQMMMLSEITSEHPGLDHDIYSSLIRLISYTSEQFFYVLAHMNCQLCIRHHAHLHPRLQ